MAHDKIFGICESKCLVETLPKDKIVSEERFDEWLNNHICKTLCRREKTADDSGVIYSVSDYIIQLSRLTKTMLVMGQCKLDNEKIMNNGQWFSGITHLANIVIKYNEIGFPVSTDFESVGVAYQASDGSLKTGVCVVPNTIVVPCDVIIQHNGVVYIKKLKALAYPEHSVSANVGKIVMENKQISDILLSIGLDVGDETLRLDSVSAIQFNVTLPIHCSYTNV